MATGRPVRRAVAVAIVVAAAGLWLFAMVLAGLDGKLLDGVTGVGSVSFAVVGAVLVVRRPDNRLGQVFLAISATSAVLGAGGVYARHALSHGWPGGQFVAWLSDFCATPTIALVAGVLPQLFPTGRPLGARWRWPLLAACGYLLLAPIGNGFYPQHLESVPRLANPYAVPATKQLFGLVIALAALFGAIAAAGTVASLVLRWRRASRDERQQLKWFLATVCLLPIPLAMHEQPNQVSDAILSVLFVVLPVTIGVAILRYRLYDLDLVISRTVGYIVVSALVAGLYLAIVGVVEAATSGSVSLAVHVIAAVAAAAAFHPVRRRLQRAVDRLFFGDRTRPYDALSALARRLEAAIDPDTVLPGVVDSVGHALRLSYVAVELHDAGGWRTAAERGRRPAVPVSFPMTYQSELVGRLLVGTRSGTDALNAADRRLLADLARQAGVAALAVRTTSALQRSRAELVAAREEERRRLRRDLHDGLGPTLAGVTLGLRAAQIKLASDPQAVQRSLESITAQVEDAIADIRRLVYGLRPPALDEFGLIRAVQMQAARIEADADSPSVVIDSPPEGLGRLPAAVEVAAYRITTEAMTNVTKHAAARTCTVRFCLNGSLELEVSDDGRGLPPDQPSGVGLTAMRERAAELGGTLVVEALSVGTRVRARLPIPEAP